MDRTYTVYVMHASCMYHVHHVCNSIPRIIIHITMHTDDHGLTMALHVALCIVQSLCR
jgi:hypothetical protein